MSMGSSSNGQLAALMRNMDELETMLREVEGVSAVLDFDLPPGRAEGPSGGGGKGEMTPRSTSHGVNVLAAEVAQELQSWRAQKEREYDRQNGERIASLQDFLLERQREAEDSAHVRWAVRQALFDGANTTIEGRLKDAALTGAVATSGEESAGGWALLQLQTRLEELLSAVERRPPAQPPQMKAAAQAATDALRSKRARAHGAAQRANFLDRTGHLDTELIDEATNVAASRQRLLGEQAGRRETMLQCLEEVATERRRDFDLLVATERRSPGPVPPEAWLPLQPSQEEVQQNQQSTFTAEGVLEEILEIGDGRMEVMVEEFSRKFLPGSQSRRSCDVEGELEVWRLQSRQNLLEELCSSSEQFHKRCLEGLQTNMEHGKETPFEQLNMAVSVAESFRNTRNDHFSKHLALVEQALSRHCSGSLSEHASRRRRAEWCALRRLQDVREAMQLLSSAAEMRCALQLGQAAHWLIRECHGALPMLSGGMDRPNPPPGKLTAALAKTSDPLRSLATVERVTAALPDSAEACAILKGMLCLLDRELQRTCKNLEDLLKSASDKLIRNPA